MLAKRVILCLTFDEGVLMRTKRFVADYRYTQAHCVAGDADELCLIDITRTGPWPGFPDLVSGYCRRIDIPASAGGNIRTWEYARRLLNSGVEKVVVGWAGRSIYEEIASQAGRQSLVAGIDYRGHPEGCKEAVENGAGEILLTCVDLDGSLAGYDLPVLQDTCRIVNVPVLVAGGCGSWQHIKAAFEAGASGAVTTNIFHMNETAMRSCKQWLAQNYDGPIRPAEDA